MKNLYLSIITIILCSTSCTREEVDKVDNALNNLLTQDEWFIFDDDGSGYTAYTFFADGNVAINKTDANDDIYQFNDGLFSLSNNKLTIKNLTYNNSETYTIRSYEATRIILEHNGKRTIMSRYSAQKNHINDLVGSWEHYNNAILAYHLYTFNPDGTYYEENIINHRLDTTETGTGTFKIQRTQLIFTPDKNGLSPYKFHYHFLEDGTLFFSRLSPGHATISYQYQPIQNGNSHRPSLTTDSKHFKTLITGKWIEYDKFASGFILWEFNENEEMKQISYKKDLTTENIYSNRFSIVNDTIFTDSWINNKYIIKSINDNKLVLNTGALEKTLIHYTDGKQFGIQLHGKWLNETSLSSSFYEIRKDGTYSYLHYGDGSELLEKEEGFYSVDLSFITLMPNEQERSAYTYQFKLNENSLYWYASWKYGPTIIFTEMK